MDFSHWTGLEILTLDLIFLVRKIRTWAVEKPLNLKWFAGWKGEGHCGQGSKVLEVEIREVGKDKAEDQEEGSSLDTSCQAAGGQAWKEGHQEQDQGDLTCRAEPVLQQDPNPLFPEKEKILDQDSWMDL